ncbi:thioesterase family protein [Rheinheimera sp.]|uniref:acyl-CoA thioesterase n=1 Tax=Rheinheimera sp. TaxID=1869214 RepID=UPI0027B9306B|nr:acyl-CoA thioesterase [Rheinheimera sp.]
MKKASVVIEVPFFDVDAMQIVWHGHYVKYLEIARCALLRTFDYDYPQMQQSGYLWPIVDLNLKYRGSARFGKQIEVTATLVEWEHRLKINYRIIDLESGQTLTKASSIQVAVDMQNQQMCYESPLILLQKLGLQP